MVSLEFQAREKAQAELRINRQMHSKSRARNFYGVLACDAALESSRLCHFSSRSCFFNLLDFGTHPKFQC